MLYFYTVTYLDTTISYENITEHGIIAAEDVAKAVQYVNELYNDESDTFSFDRISISPLDVEILPIKNSISINEDSYDTTDPKKIDTLIDNIFNFY